MKKKEIEQAAKLFKAISNPNRLKVLFVIGDGERHVNEIVQALGTYQGRVAWDLAVLREANIVSFSKDGTRVYYMIKDKRILTILKTLKLL